MGVDTEHAAQRLHPSGTIVHKMLDEPASETGEWPATPNFTIRHLAELVTHRKAEVQFTEDKGVLWVNERPSSARDTVRKNDLHNMFMRSNTGKLVAHIHEFGRREPFHDFLSWFDIWDIAYSPNPKARYVLMHPKGGVEYVQPALAPHAPDTFAAFSDEVGIDCISPRHHDAYTNHIMTVNPDRKRDLARMFAERHGMIKQEAEWKNTSGIQRLIDIINLKF